jgi:hypothetical protein
MVRTRSAEAARCSVDPLVEPGLVGEADVPFFADVRAEVFLTVA